MAPLPREAPLGLRRLEHFRQGIMNNQLINVTRRIIGFAEAARHKVVANVQSGERLLTTETRLRTAEHCQRTGR